ncbi:hypothetical protein RRG08_039213 [Elysia crispata]|uniref:Uncharacterized protein n=1 Tax=Elysia crispata TaxID=231223 RepID=A0AAE1AV49_9GAST|nr:hypothetical protein RRG08_039213 [Elysia crispata]
MLRNTADTIQSSSCELLSTCCHLEPCCMNQYLKRGLRPRILRINILKSVGTGVRSTHLLKSRGRPLPDEEVPVLRCHGRRGEHYDEPEEREEGRRK